jgi:VPDSG-CTERM motif
MTIMITEGAQAQEIALRRVAESLTPVGLPYSPGANAKGGPGPFFVGKLLTDRLLRATFKTLAWRLLILCLVGNTIKAKNMKTAKILAIVAATALGLGAAQATQINGTIGFTSAPNSSGGAVVNNGGGIFTLNFNNPLHVNFGTDDYSGVPIPTDVNFTSIKFQNGVGLIGTNVPEWTFTVGTTTYSFDLLSLSQATFMNGNLSKLTLIGDGIAHITGFTDTESGFALEATGTHLTFAILQPSNTSVPTPDGGSALALLGIGLVAVEALRRKLATA